MVHRVFRIFFILLILCVAIPLDVVNAANGTVECDFDEIMGTLYVSGSGTVTAEDVEPFSKNDVKEIWIGNQITGIGAGAFCNWTDLHKLSFERKSHLITIEQEAFRGTAIEYIVFPETLQIIEERAFYGCGRMELVEFQNEGVMETQIGKEAFAETPIGILLFHGRAAMGNGSFHNSYPHVIAFENSMEDKAYTSDGPAFNYYSQVFLPHKTEEEIAMAYELGISKGSLFYCMDSFYDIYGYNIGQITRFTGSVVSSGNIIIISVILVLAAGVIAGLMHNKKRDRKKLKA